MEVFYQTKATKGRDLWPPNTDIHRRFIMTFARTREGRLGDQRYSDRMPKSPC